MLSLSAVKAVNEFAKCGYCLLCPAYMDVTSEPDERGIPTGKVCPQDALKRRVVGRRIPTTRTTTTTSTPSTRRGATAAGSASRRASRRPGNGSLRLEIRYDRCVTCNECSILVACPEAAIVRVVTPGLSPIPREGEHRNV